MALKTLKIFIGEMADAFSRNAGACLASLFSIFVGATLAMSFQRWKENQKRMDEEHGAIVRCQMVLIAQLNAVCDIKEQHLDPFRNDPERAKKLINFRMCDAGLRVAYDSLSFLLTKKNPNLLLDVHSAEQSYLSAMGCLTWKNDAFEKMHNNSTLEKSDSKTGAVTVVLKDQRDLMQLQFLTDALYKAIGTACDKLELRVKELEKAGELLYPKRKFLKFEGRKPYEPQPASPAP
jgi:hypothetical protein